MFLLTSADKALPRFILSVCTKRAKVKKLFLFELKQTTKHEEKKSSLLRNKLLQCLENKQKLIREGLSLKFPVLQNSIIS